MQLSDLSVKRPVFAAVVAILIVVIGLVGFFNLSIREYPDVDPPVVSIQTSYTGAAATVVESRVTQVLEQSLSGVQGLQTISSRSRDGQSQITLEFAAGTDVDVAANDVRDRVGRVSDDLPDEVLAPEISKVDADASPIMFMVFSKPGWDRASAERLCRPQHSRSLLGDTGRGAGVYRRRGAAGDARSGCSRRSWRHSRSPRPMSRPRFAPRMSSFPPGGSNPMRRTSR